MWLILFLALWWRSSGIVAAKDYSIDQVNIINAINSDGSMNVEESRVYNFNGSFSYAYQYINKSGERDQLYILENFEVCDKNKCYLQKDNETNVPETFLIKDEGQRYYLKWFYQAENEKKTFLIKYKIKNAVDLGEDVAQIYWKSIGDKWEINQKNIKVDFSLPEGIDGSKIQAWGHGPLTGTVSILTNNQVSYKVDRLNKGEWLETRILLPRQAFTGGVKINKNKSQIIDEENKFIAERQAEVEKNKKIEITMMFAGLGLLVWQLILLIKNTIKFFYYSRER